VRGSEKKGAQGISEAESKGLLEQVKKTLELTRGRNATAHKRKKRTGGVGAGKPWGTTWGKEDLCWGKTTEG